MQVGLRCLHCHWMSYGDGGPRCTYGSLVVMRDKHAPLCAEMKECPEEERR